MSAVWRTGRHSYSMQPCCRWWGRRWHRSHLVENAEQQQQAEHAQRDVAAGGRAAALTISSVSEPETGSEGEAQRRHSLERAVCDYRARTLRTEGSALPRRKADKRLTLFCDELTYANDGSANDVCRAGKPNAKGSEYGPNYSADEK